MDSTKRTHYIKAFPATGIDPITNLELPQKYHLYPNFLNPINANTTIHFDLPQKVFVELTVFDIKGTKVTDLFSGYKKAGFHSVNWQASNLPSGLYFIKLQAGHFTQIQKGTFVK